MKYVADHGYVRVKAPGHPEADRWGWAYEHRVVAHDTWGPIPEGHHVHHRNHDRSDNRPSNLDVLPASVHLGQHRRIDHAEVIRLYGSGMTMGQVADRLGVTDGQVSRILKRHGVKARPAPRTQVDDEVLKRLHGEPGVRVPQIATALGVGQAVVRRRMVELGLPSFPAGRRAK